MKQALENTDLRILQLDSVDQALDKLNCMLESLMSAHVPSFYKQEEKSNLPAEKPSR